MRTLRRFLSSLSAISTFFLVFRLKNSTATSSEFELARPTIPFSNEIAQPRCTGRNGECYVELVIPKAVFGRTGHHSTRVIFGAASLGRVSQKVADETLEVLLRHGVNHIDTASV